MNLKQKYHNDSLVIIPAGLYSSIAFNIKDFDWWVDFTEFNNTVRPLEGTMETAIFIQVTGGDIVLNIKFTFPIPNDLTQSAITNSILTLDQFKDSQIVNG